MKIATLLSPLLFLGSASAMIVERDVQQDPDGNWWTTRACPFGDCAYVAPIITSSGGDGTANKKGTGGTRGRRHLENQDQDGPAFDAPKATDDPKELTIDSAGTIDIQISGWDASLGLEFVLAHEGSPEIRYPVAEPIFRIDEDAGVARAKLRPNARGVYRQYLEYTTAADEEDKIVEGGSFRYEHAEEIVRRSGPLQQVVEEAAYEGGGQVMHAVGRIYFTSYGLDYACTGTAIRDHKTGRSLILTAAHCVWDDIDEVFGTNVIFVPNRDAVTGDTLLEGNMTTADIHRQCDDDVCGCWTLSGGVVHDKWRDTPWPERLEYDYGFYVVEDQGRHEGVSCGSDALDEAVDVLDFRVGVPLEGEFVHNFGYSLEFNPDFRYCAEMAGSMEAFPGVDTAWMDSCGLTGGSSGGPWITDFDSATGGGNVVSVNSWSYDWKPGNGGPFIEESAARCLVNTARAADMEHMMAQPVGEQGVYANCHERPCITQEEAETMGTRKLSSSLRGHRQLCEGVTMSEKELAKP